MSVIIKRGEKIPITNNSIYSTSVDNQEVISVNIYEGEKKYVKYNHLLKKAILKGLSKKPRGKAKIMITFFIDANGILSVTAKEIDREEKSNNQIEFTIKNDSLNLTNEEMEKIKSKNKNYLSKVKVGRAPDYYNLKKTLKEYEDIYNETEDQEEKYNILLGYNYALEVFINKFDKNFDNEIIMEKFYIYVRLLFISYIKVFNIKNELDKDEQSKIIENIKNYADIFLVLSSGYFEDLVEILKDLPKKIFYEIVVYFIEKSNEYGKTCLKDEQKFSRYNSMKFFEKSNNLFTKYICDTENIVKMGCNLNIKNNCINQKLRYTTFLKDINSNIILLCEDALKKKKLISSSRGFSENKNIISYEEYQIVLETYEKMLPKYKDKNNLEEAIILANMIKINYELLGYTNYKLYCKWGEECESIAKKLQLDSKVEWYSDFCETYNKIKIQYHSIIENEMKLKIKTKYEKEFEEIDEKFKKEATKGFINYILEKIPYKGYEEDIKNNSKDFNNVNPELIFYLFEKYHPKHYKYLEDDEKSKLKYFLIESIDSLLNKLYTRIM
jgi:hypothetical protein